MRKVCILLFCIIQCAISFGQSTVNRQQFFLDERLIEATISTDVKKLMSDKKEPTYQPANIIMRFSDTSEINEQIRIELKGVFRKANCDMASTMLNFKNPGSPKLSELKKLKLIGECKNNSENEEWLLKEYLVYKICNILSNMSFRVRLLHITFKDTRQKVKTFTEYAFLIEDTKDMAERNNCKETKKQCGPEMTNRKQMTFVNLFEYFIGNLDWSLWNFHNIKLLTPQNDSTARPYVVPYDFDFSGVVDASYAAADEQFGTTSVVDRVYRGEKRSVEEINDALKIFKEKKERIMFYINDFALLSEKTRKTVVNYLEQFYENIESKSFIRTVLNAK